MKTTKSKPRIALRAQIARLQQREGELVGALKTIASYDEHSKHGEGICPYGCDTPHIARAALQSVAKEGDELLKRVGGC